MTNESPVVVVGTDGSDHSLTAVRRAIEEASLRNGTVHVVHVEDVTPATLHLSGGVTVSTTDLADASRKEVWDKVGPELDDVEIARRVDLDGYPADALVDYCDEVDAVLLVLGTRGRGRMASTFLGSTSMRALERAGCDVLIAK